MRSQRSEAQPASPQASGGSPVARVTSVGIRELSRNVSGVVADVARSGRPTLVTKHGVPIAAVVSLWPRELGERIVADVLPTDPGVAIVSDARLAESSPQPG